MPLKKRKYGVDIVLCVDATGYNEGVFSWQKEELLSLCRKFADKMQSLEPPKEIQRFRVKIVAFRDFEYDREPILESRFFTLDEELEDLQEFFFGVSGFGGGDMPESGLEALALSMKSDWTDEGSPRRHIIILHTNAPAKPFGTGSDNPLYPADMPKDMDGLKELWENMDARAKRLVMFAPEVSPWTEIGEWENVFLVPIRQGDFASDEDFQTCMDLLVDGI